MKEYLEKIKKVVERYGFWTKLVNENSSVKIFAKNTDGKETVWFRYDSKDDTFRGNNTDQCNIWLYETRPDLTPEDLVTMFVEIEAELKVFVDPEDWQEIADVCDAYGDRRYTHMEVVPKTTVIDGYEIRQAENYHVTIVRLSDNKTVFHCQCDKEQDAQYMLDIYREFSQR